MVVTLDNFEIGEWYGVYTEATGTIEGEVIAKDQLSCKEGEFNIITLYSSATDSTIKIPMTAIRDYFWVDASGEYAESKVFNDDLEEYGIQPGDSVTQILRKYIENWNKYDKETKEFLIGEIIEPVNDCNIQDLVTALVNYKSYFDEEHKKYLDILKCQSDFIEKYMKFKKTLPDGMDRLLDVFVFDVLGLKFE
jgi:hypothetical protein